MSNDRRVKRGEFLLAGSALSLAACSSGAGFSLVPQTARALSEGTNVRPNAQGPAALFQGYNTVLGNAASTAVEGKFTSIGAESEVTCSVCTSASQVASALQLDASLSVSYGPFSSVDAKTSFMQSLNLTASSISVVVYAKHGIGTKQFTGVKLKPGVRIPKTAKETDAFVNAYGDSFISEISEGGEYFAAYTFYTETQTDQTSLQNSLQASGIAEGVTVGASLQSAVNNFVSSTTVTVSSKQGVTGIKNPSNLPSQDSSTFVSYAANFPSLMIDSPAITGFGAEGYETVAGLNTPFFRKVAGNRRYFIVGSAEHPGGLASNLATIAGIQNQIANVQQIYTFYGYTGDSAPATKMTTAKKDFDAIVHQMNLFSKNATTSFPALPLTSIANGAPKFNYSVGASPSYGSSYSNNYGDVFSTVNLNTYLQQRVSIAQVQLYGGEVVDSIEITYQDPKNGTWKTQRWGGSGGSQSPALVLLSGQSLASMSGSAGEIVDHLTLNSTDGRSISAGGGGGSGFSWAPPAGAIFMGFHGRYLNELAQIGVDYAQILPATWNPVS